MDRRRVGGDGEKGIFMKLGGGVTQKPGDGILGTGNSWFVGM